MKLRRILSDLIGVVAAEADRNPEFAERLESVLRGAAAASVRDDHQKLGIADRRDSDSAERRHRRTPAVLDPIALAQNGESALREQLSSLTLEQLRDIVAEYGMDPGKLVMKWKAQERVVDKIIEMSLSRARKGEAFRG